MAAGFLDLAGEDLVSDEVLAVDFLRQIVLEAAREAQHRFGGRRCIGAEQRWGAMPADFNAAEQIGLRTAHPEQAGRPEMGALAENLRVWTETDLGAALVRGLADDVELRGWCSAREGLPVVRLVDHHVDFELFRQGVDDRDADAVKASRGLVGA